MAKTHSGRVNPVDGGSGRRDASGDFDSWKSHQRASRSRTLTVSQALVT